MKRIVKHGTTLYLIGIFLVISLSGCATTPVEPIQQNLSALETAILRAEDSGAETHAPLELKLAKEKLAEARKLMVEEEYEATTRLIEEAMVDANLAAAKAEAAKAKEELTEEEQDLDLLQNEINRKQTKD